MFPKKIHDFSGGISALSGFWWASILDCSWSCC